MDDKAKEIVVAAFRRLPGPLISYFGTKEEAEIDRELAEKYGEVAEKMGEERSRSEKIVKEKAESGVSPAKAYRKELESRGDACGICLEMLRRLEEKPLELQAMGVPKIAEAEGANRSGADVGELKDIMSKSDVLKKILLEMKEEES